VRGPSAPSGDSEKGSANAAPMPTKPHEGQPEEDLPRPASVPNPSGENTEALGTTEEEAEQDVKMINMGQCDQAIQSLDRQVARLHQRHAACTRQMEEDATEMAYIDKELAFFKMKLSELGVKLSLESSEHEDTEKVIKDGTSLARNVKKEQADLLQATLSNMRRLKLQSYRDTPKSIAYRSPHGILPREIRPGHASTSHMPDPFKAGRKVKPGTRSLYRPSGGLD